MYESFIIYSTTTGVVHNRCTMSAGAAAMQDPGEGRALLILPPLALASDEINLDIVKGALIIRIDRQAEQVELRFVTPGSTRAMAYLTKAAEARAWQADNSASTPFLDAEASLRGLSMEVLTAQIVQLEAAWTVIGSRIDATRVSRKEQVADAPTLEAALMAGTIDWEALLV